MREILVVPELNYWMRKTLKNSPVTDTFHRIPSDVSDVWRDPNSVLELMFNENFKPVPKGSSSSSSSGGLAPVDVESINERPYIYKYRKCNILLLPDKNIKNRLQIYRWSGHVFAANSNKFIEIFDFSDTRFVPSNKAKTAYTVYTPPAGDVETAPSKDMLWLDTSRSTPTLPKDVTESERSPHITYKTEIYQAGNYPLVSVDQKTPLGPFPPDPIYPEASDVFDFTDQDLMMLDLLYLYKTDKPVTLNGINFNNLTSCIAKLVYVYLDAFLNNNFSHYDSDEPISGSNILCTLYEKFVLDIIYLLQSEQYGVIYKDHDVVNNEIKDINIDNFMILKKMNRRVLITDEIYTENEIVLTEFIPWDRKDFYIYRDGDLLENDKDYTVVIDFSDPVNIVARIHLIATDILPGDTIEMIWSYIEPYTMYTQADM